MEIRWPVPQRVVVTPRSRIVTAPSTGGPSTATVSHQVDAIVVNAYPFLPYKGAFQAPRIVPRPVLRGTPLPITSTRTHTVDAVVLKTASLSHTVDAIVFAYPYLPYRGIFQPPRIVPRPALRGTPLPLVRTRTHTVDAIVVAQFTRTHTVDAVVLKTQTASFTVDAVVFAYPYEPYKGVVQAQRVVPRSQVRAVTVGIVTSQLSHTVDAVVLVTASRTHTVDALVYTTSSPSHIVDAIVIAYPFLPYKGEPQTVVVPPRTRTFVNAPVTAAGNTLSHQVDAVVLKTASLTHTVDALVYLTSTKTHTVDALIYAYPAEPYRGVTQQPRVVPKPRIVGLPSQTTTALNYTVDALVVVIAMLPTKGEPQTPRFVPKPQTFVNAPVLSAGTRTYTVDAVVLVAGNTRSHTVDALIVKTTALSHTVDAVVLKTLTATYTVDAVVYAYPFLPYRGEPQQARVVPRPAIAQPPSAVAGQLNYSVDAIVWSPQFALPLRAPKPTYPTDARLRSRFGYGFASGVIPQTRTRTHSVDALVQAVGNTRTYTVDAVVRKTFTPSYTADAVILKTSTRIHTVDARILAVLTRSHAVSATIFKQIPATYTVSAVILRAGVTRAHTIDAQVGLPYKTQEHQVDALVYEPFPEWPASEGDEWPQTTDDEWPQSTGDSEWPQSTNGTEWPQTTSGEW